MKQKLHIFMTLLLLVICGGVSFGQTTATLKFTDKCGGSGTDDQKNTWTISSDSKESKFEAGKGIHYGTTNAEVSYLKATTDAYADKEITKIVVNACANTTGSPKVSCTVGGNSFGSEQALTASNVAYTFDGSAKGAIEVAITKSKTKKALYLLSVEVTYKDGGSSEKTSTTLSFGADYDGKTVSLKANETLSTPATLTPAVAGAKITYDSSDKTVAEIDKDGIVYAYKEGTTTITASYAGDDTYAASSASYTLNVVDGRTATTLTFPTSSYTFELGSGDQVFTNAAILNPAEAGTVTYKSSDENLAVVGDDGSVVVSTDKAGTATITATFAGNDNYKASEASYTIEVVKKAGQVEDGVFDFTDGTIDYGSGLRPSTATTYITSSTWKAGNVTITTTGGTGIRWWTATDGNELRVYKKTKFAISVPDGYVITNIDLGVFGSMTADCGTLNNSKWTGASQVVTITPSATKNIKNITVKYTKCETLTTAASGFSTYAFDYDVDYSEAGLKAYAITLDEAAKTVKYTEATGVVPAGKAVLVKGEANKEYTLTPATEAAGEFTTDLQISDGTVTTEGGLYYAFATVDGKSGFKKLANGMTIPAKKGYLKLSAASAKGFFELDDTTTGIKGISEDIIDEEETPLFNLAGQRVSKSYKGVVVKNGKKFVNK